MGEEQLERRDGCYCYMSSRIGNNKVIVDDASLGNAGQAQPQPRTLSRRRQPAVKTKSCGGEVDSMSAEADLALLRRLIMIIMLIFGAWESCVMCYEFLYGLPPFEAKEHCETYQRLIHRMVKVVLKFPSKPFVSAGAKDLISQMLVKNPTKRIPLDKLLQHPWLLQNADPSGAYRG